MYMPGGQWNASVEFRKEVQAGDVNKGIINIQMAFKVIGLDEVCVEMCKEKIGFKVQIRIL